MSDIGDIAKLILELIKIGKELFPDEVEKFEKEWKDDQKEFQTAFRDRDAVALNRLLDKYHNLLSSLV